MLDRWKRRQIFQSIIQANLWQGKSRSGTGSDPEQTAKITKELPDLLRKLGVKKLADIPCGDFNWMSKVDLSGVSYIGGDLVPAIIEINIDKYARPNIRFCTIDIISDHLPAADALLVRDCFVHLPFDSIKRSIENIKKSDIRYLITTTFPDSDKNTDIEMGDWRTLNLELAPFLFPPPIKIINEGCTEGENQYVDKSLGVWQVSALPDIFS